MVQIDFIIPYQQYLKQYGKKTSALYHAIRDAAVLGVLAAGTRLPSSRELAAMYGVSRGAVNVAFEMLAADGYVRSEVGRGTYVVFSGHLERFVNPHDAKPQLSAFGQRVGEMARNISRATANDSEMITFAINQVDVAHFPQEQWRKSMNAQIQTKSRFNQTDFEVPDPLGYLPLREAIATYLATTRGIRAHAEQIAIVNGSQQAIVLLSLLLIGQNQKVAVEQPGYGGARRAIEVTGGQPVYCPIDREGMVIPDDAELRLAFVTPGRQFPTGIVMSLDRRQRLLEWADRQGAFLIEDDYDSEFRRGGRPIEPLKALDVNGRVIFIGTFSRTMPRAVRLGFVVLPDTLTPSFRNMKQLLDPYPSSLYEQQALTDFMRKGEYARHIRRMQRIYTRKYELLHRLSAQKLASWISFIPSNAGLHLFGRWKGDEYSFLDFIERCHANGVSWQQTRDYYTTNFEPSLCLGFAHLTDQQIESGVERMAQSMVLLN